MKQIKCELCGSVELIKQDGVYVCQHCSAKYSVEEAKKMMVDGVVEVKGKIKMDTSEKLANLYQVARRAKKDGNDEIAAKYYDMILVDDPNSWEAVFYIVYFKAMQCKIGGIPNAATSLYNCTGTVLELIKDKLNEDTEQEKAVMEVADRIISISKIFFNGAKNAFYDIESTSQKYLQEYLYRSFSSIFTAYNLGNLLESLFEDKKYACNLAVCAWKSGIKSHREAIKEFKTIHDSYYSLFNAFKDDNEKQEFIDSTITLRLINGKETITISKSNPDNERTLKPYIEKIGKYDPLFRLSETKEKVKLEKSWRKTLLLCLFLGIFGAHRFYTKSYLAGIFQLFTLGGCFIFTFIDLVSILIGTYEDGNGYELVNKWKWKNTDSIKNPELINNKPQSASTQPEPVSTQPQPVAISNEGKVAAQAENTRNANKLGCLLWGLCFILPLVGLILFFVYTSKGEKSKAKSAIIAAAIGFALFLLLLLI